LGATHRVATNVPLSDSPEPVTTLKLPVLCPPAPSGTPTKVAVPDCAPPLRGATVLRQLASRTLKASAATPASLAIRLSLAIW
jgi:hypothetical protein